MRKLLLVGAAALVLGGASLAYSRSGLNLGASADARTCQTQADHVREVWKLVPTHVTAPHVSEPIAPAAEFPDLLVSPGVTAPPSLVRQPQAPAPTGNVLLDIYSGARPPSLMAAPGAGAAPLARPNLLASLIGAGRPIEPFRFAPSGPAAGPTPSALAQLRTTYPPNLSTGEAAIGRHAIVETQ